MKTKQELANVILKNAKEEAAELIEWAEGVAALVLKKFPDKVPDAFVKSQHKSTDTALLGALRKPEDSVGLMLERCLTMKRHEEENA